MHYELCIPNPPYPRPWHIRHRVPPDPLQFHKHPFLMLVLHHDSFHTCEWAADYYHAVAGDEGGHLRLIDNDIGIARFYDDAETLHLSVGDCEEIVGAV